MVCYVFWSKTKSDVGGYIMAFFESVLCMFRKKAPIPLRLMRRGAILAVVDSKKAKKVNDGNWELGWFSWDSQTGKFGVSLGMQCNVIRNGRTWQVGWDGNEEHIASYCDLIPGDTLRYDRIGSGIFEDADLESVHPDIVVSV